MSCSFQQPSGWKPAGVPARLHCNNIFLCRSSSSFIQARGSIAFACQLKSDLRGICIMTEAFWIPEGNGMFRATIHTQGPWSPQFQHGGAPAALLVRQLEICSPREDMMLARVSIDILAPVPIASFTASATVL